MAMNYTHKVDTENFKGEVIIELLPWKERIAKTKEVSYEIVNGELKERSDFDKGAMALEISLSRVKSVSVKNGENEITSIDELLNYKEGMEVAREIQSIILNGISIEKK